MDQKRSSATFLAATALLFVLASGSPGCGPGLGKGDGLAASGDLQGAAEVYRKVYDRKPTDKVALIKLGRTLYLLNMKRKDDGEKVSGADWKETYDLLDRGKKVEPVPPEVDPIRDFELSDSAFEAGKALAAEGKNSDACKLLDAAKANGKTGAKLEEALYRARVEAGDKDGAVDAALEAVSENSDDGALLRESALIALDRGRTPDCHELILAAENRTPSGFKFKTHKQIKALVSRSYFFLTTGMLETVLTTPVMDAQRIKDWKADEQTMTKPWGTYQKRPPDEVMKEDKPYFQYVLFHLHVTHGLAAFLLCDFEAARKCWSAASALDPTRIKAPSDVPAATLADELGWPARNLETLDKLSK